VFSLAQQDTDYPVRELLYHSPQTRGWQSPRCAKEPGLLHNQPCTCVCAVSSCAAALHRFCKYPQELVLRLERPSKVQQIQILAHEYKVGGARGHSSCMQCVPVAPHV
jgi:centrosomal protein CEP104